MGLTREQFDIIYNKYNNKRLNNNIKQNKRLQDVYAKIPEIKECDLEISSLSINAARAALNGDTSLKSRLKDLEAEVESLKIKALLLLVICVVISIFASFSVMNIARQYSTIHDYYMDSQRNDRETGRSLDELIQKIEEFDAKTD